MTAPAVVPAPDGPLDRAALADVLVTFSRHLTSGYVVADILDALCDRIADVLPVSGAGVMLEDDDGVLRFVAASDDTIHEIESLQIELDEGPCRLAYRTGEQVVVDDLATSDAFPAFGPPAVERGLRAVFSFPMRAGDDHVGALNLYCSTPSAFTDEDRATGQVLADVATAYIVNARTAAAAADRAAQLQHALDSRVAIEQAKGKVAEQRGISVTAAFELLRRHARSHGRQLRAVAQEVVTGDLRL